MRETVLDWFSSHPPSLTYPHIYYNTIDFIVTMYYNLGMTDHLLGKIVLVAVSLAVSCYLGLIWAVEHILN